MSSSLACTTTWNDNSLKVYEPRFANHSSHHRADTPLAFDEVASHDVEWGAKSVDWLSQGRANKHKQAYVSHEPSQAPVWGSDLSLMPLG